MGLCRVREGEGASGGSKVPTRRSLSRPRSESARQALCHDSHALIRSILDAREHAPEREDTHFRNRSHRAERERRNRATDTRQRNDTLRKHCYILASSHFLSLSLCSSPGVDFTTGSEMVSIQTRGIDARQSARVHGIGCTVYDTGCTVHGLRMYTQVLSRRRTIAARLYRPDDAAEGSSRSSDSSRAFHGGTAGSTARRNSRALTGPSRLRFAATPHYRTRTTTEQPSDD